MTNIDSSTPTPSAPAACPVKTTRRWAAHRSKPEVYDLIEQTRMIEHMASVLRSQLHKHIEDGALADSSKSLKAVHAILGNLYGIMMSAESHVRHLTSADLGEIRNYADITEILRDTISERLAIYHMEAEQKPCRKGPKTPSKAPRSSSVGRRP